MAGGGSASNSSSTTGVRIVVAGDHGTGKSSLILATAADSLPTNVPSVLPPTRLPVDMFPDRVPVTIIDTSSSLENKDKLDDELKSADAVVLTYACDKTSALARLTTFWLPELIRLKVKVPVIVAGCKSDLADFKQVIGLERVMPIMKQFREIDIDTCIECSASKRLRISEVFNYAQKAALYPIAPLFDLDARTLKPRCMRALKRIFIICDHDKDGALSDAELNGLQVKCFNAPLQPSEIVGIKRVVQEKLPACVNENGLTLAGFLSLHAIFFENGSPETTWTILRKHGYNNDIRLSENHLLPPVIRTNHQSVQLTSEAVEFLRGVFTLFDSDGDGALNADELDDLFSTAPESPWREAPYVNAAEKNEIGGLSLDGFLSEWALMSVLDPVLCVENLIYIGYAGDPSSALRVMRKRCVDHTEQNTEQNVFQCFVFGPKEAGKSSFLHSFVGRPFSEVYMPTTKEQYTVNIVDQPVGTKRTLILSEIPEDAVENLLIQKDALAACDIAVFVYDSSNNSSWIRTIELLGQVASHGESTGYEVPCIIIAAKGDLEPNPTALQDSTRLSQDMGIEAPVPISTRLGDFTDVYKKIVRAAEHPHLSIHREVEVRCIN
ncbi:mitochondrial Rho GTPase 1 [Helianthus annuus]|uniref:mitochondrial Rho GTPase 1 n=1 Tax=Helianthus annuus TaxID=4232 RepID=UPI000B908795|nr:mitochondrial Rho GTPase 1 [Helianthus annuus]